MAKRKKPLYKSLLVAAILVATATVGYYVYVLNKYANARFVQYPAFGIEIPVNYSIHGIDVSRYQQHIYWKGVKDMRVKNVQVGFAFIKATEGTGDTDRFFTYNWKQARTDSLTRGAYHFFIATKSGKEQARHFIKQVKLLPGDLPPVVDVEDLYGTSPGQMQQQLKACLNELEKHYGVKPILYTYVSFYNQFLGTAFDAYPLWVAHYLEKEKPRIERDWLFWQHNDAGHVNGIDAYVDFNVFKGDSLAFKKLLIQ
jgi:lysozyme